MKKNPRNVKDITRYKHYICTNASHHRSLCIMSHNLKFSLVSIHNCIGPQLNIYIHGHYIHYKWQQGSAISTWLHSWNTICSVLNRQSNGKIRKWVDIKCLLWKLLLIQTQCTATVKTISVALISTPNDLLVFWSASLLLFMKLIMH